MDKKGENNPGIVGQSSGVWPEGRFRKRFLDRPVQVRDRAWAVAMRTDDKQYNRPQCCCQFKLTNDRIIYFLFIKDFPCKD